MFIIIMPVYLYIIIIIIIIIYWSKERKAPLSMQFSNAPFLLHSL